MSMRYFTSFIYLSLGLHVHLSVLREKILIHVDNYTSVKLNLILEPTTLLVRSWTLIFFNFTSY